MAGSCADCGRAFPVSPKARVCVWCLCLGLLAGGFEPTILDIFTEDELAELRQKASARRAQLIFRQKLTKEARRAANFAKKKKAPAQKTLVVA